MENNKIAIIIGAGPAGLTAAYELLTTTDIRPVILEESDEIGGISRTAVYKGNRIDIGGHRFFTKVDRVNDLWKSILPVQGAPSFDDALLGREKPLSAGGPDPEKEDRVMLVRNRVSRIYFLKKFFAYPISLSWETIKNMGFWRTLKAGCGYLWSAVFKKKETNLRNFYINRFGKPLYEMFFEDYTEKVWGVNPKDISAEWGAQRVKGLSLFKAVWNKISSPFRKKSSKKVETSLIEQFLYPKNGPGQFYETLADEVRRLGGDIVMNARVDDVKTENGRVVSVSANGREYAGDYFISSMPVKDLCNSMHNVPEDVLAVTRELPYRDFITVGLLCDRMAIQNKTRTKTLSNIVPDCWIYVQERDVKLGRLQIFNNWSPYLVVDPEHTVWIGLEYFCTEGDELWNMTDADFIEFAKEEAAHIGVVDKADIKDAVRVKQRKAYPSYFGTYQNFPVAREWLQSFENLYCVGRNGQHRYNNMDHSILSAMVAVDSIRTGKDRLACWDVNTEKEYHEKK
ncbi:MAG: NAD(P)/FAD-dependent oxidoreductase [Clostridia bacterium]|nr:NAD(P)/FAD-dependent oxidoreductase [Clostridia bacterium]